MSALRERFLRLSGEPSDINEHLGLLRGLACDLRVRSIYEIGFRTGVSATALATAGKPLTCIDKDPCVQSIKKLRALTKLVHFVHGDSLTVPIMPHDLLHIDGMHTYKQVLAELRRYAPRCSTWIALHDTETFGEVGKDGTAPGLRAAISEFLAENQEWKLHLHLIHCNGMTVLSRRD